MSCIDLNCIAKVSCGFLMHSAGGGGEWRIWCQHVRSYECFQEYLSFTCDMCPV